MKEAEPPAHQVCPVRPHREWDDVRREIGYQERKYARMGIKRKGAPSSNSNLPPVDVFYALDVSTTAEVEWLEIPIQLANYNEDPAKKLKEIEDSPALPRVCTHWVERDRIVLITEPRGERLLTHLLEIMGVLPYPALKHLAIQAITAVAWMKEKGLNSPVRTGNITLTQQGTMYIHADSIWQELLGIGSAEVPEEDERMYGLGLLLLALGTGQRPQEIEDVNIKTLTEEKRGRFQKAVVEWILRIKNAYFGEVVLKTLRLPQSTDTFDDIRALHFFHSEGLQDTELSCSCAPMDDLPYDYDSEEKNTYNPALPQTEIPGTESIYDHKRGVTVKASNLDNNMLSFQMHFFKKSKSVSFYFNKQEDTVENVIKEMEEEGLTEEKQSELIKAYMEKLIVKIEGKVASSFTPHTLSPGSSTSNTTASNNTAITSNTTITNSTTLTTTPTTSVTPTTSEPSSNSQHKEASREISEDSTEYPVTECKDAQPVQDFVQEVAAYAKRSKSTAESWTAQLKKQDIKTVGDLRMLVEEDWDSIGLPVFASRTMKNMLFGYGHTPIREAMLTVDEDMQIYDQESKVDALLEDVAKKYSRPELLNNWLQKVKCQDIRTVGELKLLQEEDWEQLQLTVFSYRVIRNTVLRVAKCVISG